MSASDRQTSYDRRHGMASWFCFYLCFFFFPVNKVSRPTYLYEQRKDGSFEIFKILFILCIWVLYIHICVCSMRMSGAHGGQKRTLDSLELELEMMWATMLVLGMESRASGRTTALNPEPSPLLLMLICVDLSIYYWGQTISKKNYLSASQVNVGKLLHLNPTHSGFPC